MAVAAACLGDLQRALTASVTFGRFMNEPLDWERWSTFSQNQTRDDVQKHSKPGSVAEMAAFFDAHYKKIAAKKAAKPPEKENIAPTSSSETNAAMGNGPINSDLAKSVSLSAIGERQGNEARTHGTELVPSINTYVEQEEASARKVVSTQNPIQVKDAPSYRDKVLSSQKKPVYSSKSLSENGAYKLRSPVKPPPLPVSPKKEENVTPKSRISARDAMEKNRSAPPSLHKLMNSSSRAQKSNDTSSSPFVPKNGNSKIVKAIAAGRLKDRLAPQPPTTGVLKHSQAVPHPEKRRSKTPPSCSVTGSRSTFGKPPLSTNLSEPLSDCRKKSRPPTVLFKSEERGAKRKVKAENDHKKLRQGTALETKTSTSKVKLPIHNMKKVKAENNLKELHQSTALKTKASTSKVKPPSSNMKKVKAENDHKKLQRSTKLETKASTSKVKLPSNNLKKVKAENDHKKLHRSTNVKTNASTIKVKPPSNDMKKVKAEHDHKRLHESSAALKAKPSEAKTPSSKMKKVKAENDHKELQRSTVLKTKASTSKVKPPSNNTKKTKAENGHKELHRSTALKTKANTCKVKPPSNNMKKVKAENSTNLGTKASASKVKPPSSNMKKVKAEDDHKKLRQCTAALKEKPGEAKLPINKMKVLPTQPRSPKLGRKGTAIPVQDSCYPQKSSSNTNNDVIEKTKKRLGTSVASLLSKAA